MDNHARKRLSCLEYYGNGKAQCILCGEDRVPALVIDHINGSGAEHRKQLKTNNIYRWLISNSFPEGFQTLCANCHAVRHDEERQQQKDKNRTYW